jgi:hypothetical protein
VAPPVGIAALDDDKVQCLVKETRDNARLKALLIDRHAAARKEFHYRYEQFQAGRGTLDILLAASGRLCRAEQDLNPSKETQVAAWKNHLKRLQNVELIVKESHKAGKMSTADLVQAQEARLGVEIDLERARDK